MSAFPHGILLALSNLGRTGMHDVATVAPLVVVNKIISM